MTADGRPRRAGPSRRTLLAVLAVAGCGVASSAKGHGALSSAPPSRAATAPVTPAPTSATPTHAAPTPTPSPADPQAPAVEIVNGSRAKSQVALTFHGSGDPGLALALLQAAEAKSASITVFAVGNWLAANEALGRRILAGGHELANHTYTHPDLGALPEAAVEEVAKAGDVLQQVSGTNGLYARPSQMNRATPLVLAAAGRVGYRTVVAFDVDPSDYLDPGAALVISRTLAGVQRGSIVSMHLGHEGTVQALPAILDGLSSRGLRPVTVKTLLS
jgi:peptidoglycan/xylan/chitin deacetylase (PgdA/CDA1 family)